MAMDRDTRRETIKGGSPQNGVMLNAFLELRVDAA